MKMSKLTILMIAVVALGIFALPAAFSVNTGQHTFKQVSLSDPSAFCNQCHKTGDSVAAELNLSDNGLYNGGKIHATQNCGSCHALTQGYGAKTGTSTKSEHAAVIPSCLKCHGSTNPVSSLLGNVDTELSGGKEAHKPLWDASKAANATANTDDLACLGCHTGVAKSGTIAYDYTLTHTTTLGTTGLTVGQ